MAKQLLFGEDARAALKVGLATSAAGMISLMPKK